MTTLAYKIVTYCNAYNAAIRGADANPVLLTITEMHRDELLAAIRDEVNLDKAEPGFHVAAEVYEVRAALDNDVCPECKGERWTGTYGIDLATCRTCRTAGVVTVKTGANQ